LTSSARQAGADRSDFTRRPTARRGARPPAGPPAGLAAPAPPGCSRALCVPGDDGGPRRQRQGGEEGLLAAAQGPRQQLRLRHRHPRRREDLHGEPRQGDLRPPEELRGRTRPPGASCPWHPLRFPAREGVCRRSSGRHQPRPGGAVEGAGAPAAEGGCAGV